MKLSIITAVFNAAHTVEDCLAGVASQSFQDIEHIIVDGGSSDGTLEKIKKRGSHVAQMVSGPDRGIYDAINKGIKLAHGDVVGTLNADDFYADGSVAGKVMDTFAKTGCDSCYGDLLYVSAEDVNRVIRYWVSGEFHPGRFARGWMPPHPTFFVKREIYEKYGGFNIDFRIAADYELMLRLLLKHRISARYIPEVLVKMRWGGESNKSFGNIVRKTREDLRAWKVNGLSGRWSAVFLKNVSKLPQFLKKYQPA
jgi:glycosyltransferase